MAKPLISLPPNMDVRHCARMFERFGLSVAPVMENEQILGVVSYNDLVLKGLYSEAG
jgi:Mg/Co/Ni transporter MgtE